MAERYKGNGSHMDTSSLLGNYETLVSFTRIKGPPNRVTQSQWQETRKKTQSLLARNILTGDEDSRTIISLKQQELGERDPQLAAEVHEVFTQAAVNILRRRRKIGEALKKLSQRS